MSSDDPAFTTAVAIWVDGKPVRPGLTMRARMALHSLFGSAFTPIVVTVTPSVDWKTLQPIDRKSVDASLPAFLQRHHDLDQTIGALAAR
jgi:hypothetical protein